MNFKLLALLVGLPLSGSAADKLPRDPTQEPRTVLEDRTEISTSAPSGWHKEDLGVFSVFAPSDMKRIRIDGIDSSHWEFRSKRLTLNFEYGGYPQTTASYYGSGGRGLIRRYLIDTRPADFINPESGFMAFFQPEYEGGFSLSVSAHAKSAKDLKTAELIMRTIRFPKMKRQ